MAVRRRTEKIAALKERKTRHEGLLEELERSGDGAVSSSRNARPIPIGEEAVLERTGGSRSPGQTRDSEEPARTQGRGKVHSDLRRGTGRWLRVFRWVGVVLCNTRDQSRIGQRLQVGDQRLGSRLRVDLMTLDVKSEHLQILRFLRRILDGFLGPLVEWVMPNAFALGFSDIARECVELAGQRRLMSGQNSGQRPQLRRTEISPRELGHRCGKINPNLVLPLFAHDQRPSWCSHPENRLL